MDIKVSHHGYKISMPPLSLKNRYWQTIQGIVYRQNENILTKTYVCMIWKYHNHTYWKNPRHHEDETYNTMGEITLN